MSNTDAEPNECIICLEPIKKRVLLPCNHSPCCLRCFLTQRTCYNKLQCPFCQKEINRDPIITDTAEITQYKIECLKKYQLYKKYHVFYNDPSTIQEIELYHQFKCRECNGNFQRFRQFFDHLRNKHHLTTCEICCKEKRTLPAEVVSYTAKDLKKHLKQHPKCSVCPFIAFDYAALTEHMRENHFRCDICAANNRIIWFPTIETIQVHFHEEHYACDNPMCIQQGFIVFATPTELQLHKIQVHGENIVATLDFRGVPEEEHVNYRKEAQKRQNTAKKKLRSQIKEVLNNDENKEKQFFDALKRLELKKMSAPQFLKLCSNLFRENNDRLFTSIAAAISAPAVRANLVKVRSGIRPCRLPSSTSMPTMEDFPQMDDEPPPPPTIEQQVEAHPPPHPLPKPQSRKKGKRIVLTSY